MLKETSAVPQGTVLQRMKKMLLLCWGLVQIKSQFGLVKDPATLLLCPAPTCVTHSQVSICLSQHSGQEENSSAFMWWWRIKTETEPERVGIFFVLWEASGNKKKWKKNPLLSLEIQQTKETRYERKGMPGEVKDWPKVTEPGQGLLRSQSFPRCSLWFVYFLDVLDLRCHFQSWVSSCNCTPVTFITSW